MATITRSQFVDTLDRNLNDIHQDGLKDWGEEYSKIFNVKNSDQSSEIDSYISGFGSMPQKNEGADATFDAVIPGIKKTYSHLTYALGYEVTEEAIEDNQQKPETFNKLPTALSRSAIETVEVSAANIINNGFTTAGFDGKVLFATDHPKLGGGTQSNRPTTPVDLSVTSLTAGLTAVDKYTDERGLKLPTKAVQLVVPSDLWNVARELLGSDYKPYTANNETNVLRDKNLTFCLLHYLSDVDAWFLLADKASHMLTFYWRVRLGALRKDTDFDSTNLKHLQRMRFSVGYSHFMGTYGSPGA